MSHSKQSEIPKFDANDYRSLATTAEKTFYITERKRSAPQFIKDNHLKVYTTFDYIDELIQLVIWSGHFTFVPLSARLRFKNQDVTFISYQREENDAIKVGEHFSTQLHFDNVNIDFFGFSARELRIEFKYYSPRFSKNTIFTSNYTLKLPVIKSKVLTFNRPVTVLPSTAIRNICHKEFNLDETNTKEEIKMMIELESFKQMDIEKRYEACGYFKMLCLYLNIENSFELDLADKCSFDYAKLVKLNKINFQIETPFPITNQAERVRLTPMSVVNDRFNNNKTEEEIAKKQITGQIINYLPKSIVVEIIPGKSKSKQIDLDERYRVELVPNFFTSAMAFAKIKRLERQSFEQFFVDFDGESIFPKYIKDNEEVSEFKWFNQSVGTNKAQSDAIVKIVNRTNFPSPYIVFGPPGTGKTSTLVEAVAQIVYTLKNNKVLITANSNSACDEIGDRLLKYVGANKMYRFYSPSFEKRMERVHPKLKSCSNLRYSYHTSPSMLELMSYDVVICTLVNSGRLSQIPSNHFDFVFVDECASSAEAYVTIPLSLTMNHNLKFKASFVFLGDHKQLGQIMRTYHSERFGFNISMMERVMAMERYKFDQDVGFDENLITQLTDNFRSHASILDFSNKNFYNSILKAKQIPEIANFALGWKMLPNKNVPLIFQASWTRSQMEDTSHFNMGDIAFIRKFVHEMMHTGINGKKISKKDIGVISPYAVQREKLKTSLPQGIEIGTVEYFQGREKLIIILSCVRSKTKTIGFLNNEKRLNVALTRAKGLLIVVGNPETLGKNKMWRKFITQCKLINAVAGKVPNWVSKRGIKELKKDEFEEDDDFTVRLEAYVDGINIEE